MKTIDIKSLIIGIIPVLLFGCGETNRTNQADQSNPIKENREANPPSKQDVKALRIDGNPEAKYNGVYKRQSTLINGKPFYDNDQGMRLYFYNAHEGGIRGWSLDDKKPDGSRDWCEGGWIAATGGSHPPLGTYPWSWGLFRIPKTRSQSRWLMNELGAKNKFEPMPDLD